MTHDTAPHASPHVSPLPRVQADPNVPNQEPSGEWRHAATRRQLWHVKCDPFAMAGLRSTLPHAGTPSALGSSMEATPSSCLPIPSGAFVGSSSGRQLTPTPPSSAGTFQFPATSMLPPLATTPSFPQAGSHAEAHSSSGAPAANSAAKIAGHPPEIPAMPATVASRAAVSTTTAAGKKRGGQGGLQLRNGKLDGSIRKFFQSCDKAGSQSGS